LPDIRFSADVHIFFFFSPSLFLRAGILEGERERERASTERKMKREEGGRGKGAREACVQNPQRFCNKCIDDNKNKNIKGRKDVFLC